MLQNFFRDHFLKTFITIIFLCFESLYYIVIGVCLSYM